MMSERNLVLLAFSGDSSVALCVGEQRARPQGGDQLGGYCKNPAERGRGRSGSRDGEDRKL